MTYLVLLLKLIYFMLPAYFANMSPVFAKYIFSRQIVSPIDFGVKTGGHPLFGKHKTIGGFIFGALVALGIGYLQFILYPRLKDFCFIDYHNLWATASLLLGLGALIGDLVKSFFKRMINIKAGKSWLPFDQLDFVIGALIFVSPVYFLGWINIIIIVFISLIGHILINWIGYLLNIRKKSDIIDVRSYFANFFKKWQRKHHF